MKCFYHSADLDGHCSGAIVKMKFPECEMFGINYGQSFPFDKIVPGEDVFMVDFCLQPFEGMERLNSMCRLHWIDHHEKGSIDEAYFRGFLASGGQYLKVGTAGCELTWEYVFQGEAMPKSVHLLGRYDVWDHSADKDVLPFQYGMRMFGDTSPGNQSLWNFIFSSDCGSIAEKGRLVIQYEQLQNAKFCNAYAFETELEGLKAVCINRGFTNSKIFESVYDPNVHHLMITFCRLKLPKRLWTVSLYSTRLDVDCGAVAKRFGGGGHKGAAGFQCDRLPFDY